MTAPAPPPGEQPTPPPARPTGPQSDSVSAAQDEEISALGPALAAFMLSVLAYARTTGRVAGLPITIARKVGYYALVSAALEAVAARALDHQRVWSGRRQADELWPHTDIAIAAGVEAGLTTLAQAAKVIARRAREDEAAGGAPGISLPGEPYDAQAAEDARSYADPEKIALPVVQSTRHAAQLAAAEAAGWTRKRWIDMHDNRVRASHAFLGSSSYEFHTVPILEPFVTIDGNKLWYPGDTSAPPSEWMRCRCWLQLLR